MPTIKNIIWKIIPEGTSRTLALETGEVDVIYNVETADIARLQANDKFHVEQKTSVDNYYMCLNTDVAPSNDVNLRQAINCAIDREAIIVGALNGYGTPSYSAVPMGYYGSWDANANRYDLEKAKSYLAAWGGDRFKRKPCYTRKDRRAYPRGDHNTGLPERDWHKRYHRADRQPLLGEPPLLR